MTNEQLLEQLQHEDEDSGVDLIYDFMFKLFEEEKYIQCNDLLNLVSVNEQPLLFTLAFLTITVPYKHLLLSRVNLFVNVSAYLRDNPDAPMLLYGL